MTLDKVVFSKVESRIQFEILQEELLKKSAEMVLETVSLGVNEDK